MLHRFAMLTVLTLRLIWNTMILKLRKNLHNLIYPPPTKRTRFRSTPQQRLYAVTANTQMSTRQQNYVFYVYVTHDTLPVCLFLLDGLF